MVVSRNLLPVANVLTTFYCSCRSCRSIAWLYGLFCRVNVTGFILLWLYSNFSNKFQTDV